MWRDEDWKKRLCGSLPAFAVWLYRHPRGPTRVKSGKADGGMGEISLAEDAETQRRRGTAIFSRRHGGTEKRQKRIEGNDRHFTESAQERQRRVGTVNRNDSPEIREFQSVALVRTKDTFCHMAWLSESPDGPSRQTLLRWEQEGRIIRVDCGLYVPAEEADQDNLAEAAAAIRHPKGVICLISALRLHGLGTQVPQMVWMAVPRGSVNNAPRKTRTIRLLKWAPEHLQREVETRQIAGVTVHLTDPARTILDCWRCPRMIGRESALEALRDGISKGISRGRLAQLAEYYKVRSIRPVLEALS